MALFTAETAAEMGRRSAEARKQAALLAEQAAVEPLSTQPATEPVLDFAKLRLTRVQRQLDSVDALITAELEKDKPDPKRIKELADASTRLQEQERQLAGRPLPGTLKPSARQPKRTELPEPTPIQPVVVAPQSGQSSPSSEPPKSS